jgi:hypothetical protein
MHDLLNNANANDIVDNEGEDANAEPAPVDMPKPINLDNVHVNPD